MIFLLRGGWCFLSVILATFIIVRPLQAANWSQTELHLQQGTFQAPYTHQEYDATIITFQHASKWQYGDNYFFIDQISRESENDYYGEFYSNISYSKIFKKTIGLSLVNDIGLTLGLNVAGDANVKKYLPGGYISWNLEGFTFLKTTLTAYIDDNQGAPVAKEDDSYMIDTSWHYPFQWAGQDLSITGHIEYIHKRENQFGNTVSSWILAQPQLRWDLGRAMFGAPKQLFIGVEYQYWQNKAGDKHTDERVLQLLAVWRL